MHFKKVFVIFSFIAIAIAFGYNNASDKNQTQNAEEVLKNIFTLVKINNFQDALNDVAISSGSKETLVWNGINRDNKGEVNTGKRLLRRIQKYLRLSDEYKIKSSSKSGNNVRITVDFISKGRTISVAFEFINLQGKYYLIDID